MKTADILIVVAVLGIGGFLAVQAYQSSSTNTAAQQAAAATQAANQSQLYSLAGSSASSLLGTIGSWLAS